MAKATEKTEPTTPNAKRSSQSEQTTPSASTLTAEGSTPLQFTCSAELVHDSTFTELATVIHRTAARLARMRNDLIDEKDSKVEALVKHIRIARREISDLRHEVSVLDGRLSRAERILEKYGELSDEFPKWCASSQGIVTDLDQWLSDYDQMIRFYLQRESTIFERSVDHMTISLSKQQIQQSCTGAAGEIDRLRTRLDQYLGTISALQQLLTQSRPFVPAGSLNNKPR